MIRSDLFRPSFFLFIIAGVLILVGLPTYWTENFEYWLFTRSLYGIGAVMFWFDK